PLDAECRARGRDVRRLPRVVDGLHRRRRIRDAGQRAELRLLVLGVRERAALDELLGRAGAAARTAAAALRTGTAAAAVCRRPTRGTGPSVRTRAAHGARAAARSSRRPSLVVVVIVAGAHRAAGRDEAHAGTD